VGILKKFRRTGSGDFLLMRAMNVRESRPIFLSPTTEGPTSLSNHPKTTMSWDNLEELLSFMVASQPSCPLPLLTLHESTGENKPTNSNDLLFEMMRQALYSATDLPMETKQSMNTSKKHLHERLHRDISAVDTGCPVTDPPTEWTEASREQIYGIMCSNFRDLVAVYTRKPTNDIRFLPMDSIHPTTRINTSAAEHFHAVRDITRMGRPSWNRENPQTIMEIPIQDLCRRPYWFNVCLHAHKIRLEEANII